VRILLSSSTKRIRSPKAEPDIFSLFEFSNVYKLFPTKGDVFYEGIDFQKNQELKRQKMALIVM
jgi:hypothetical protein